MASCSAASSSSFPTPWLLWIVPLVAGAGCAACTAPSLEGRSPPAVAAATGVAPGPATVREAGSIRRLGVSSALLLLVGIPREPAVVRAGDVAGVPPLASEPPPPESADAPRAPMTSAGGSGGPAVDASPRTTAVDDGGEGRPAALADALGAEAVGR